MEPELYPVEAVERVVCAREGVAHHQPADARREQDGRVPRIAGGSDRTHRARHVEVGRILGEARPPSQATALVPVDGEHLCLAEPSVEGATELDHSVAQHVGERDGRPAEEAAPEVVPRIPHGGPRHEVG